MNVFKYTWTVFLCLMLFGTIANTADIGTEKSIHPPVILKDTDGIPVKDSGRPVSTRRSCGSCHDYETISLGYHSQQGRLEMRTWNGAKRQFPYLLSRGMYGKWCSMPNRQLAPLDVQSPDDFDMSTPEWIRSCGTCHVGGGVSELDRRDRRYTEVSPETVGELDPDYHYYSNKKQKIMPWDWQESGVAEVDCFLCHIRSFNRPARDEMIRGGYFEWAATATLEGTGIVINELGEYVYNPDAFDETGAVKPQYLKLDEPGPENCGQCHGFVGTGENENDINPFFSRDLLRGTKKFGRVWSSGRIKNSNVNLNGKEKMDFPWDVHAAKSVNCIDCHFSPNDPARKIRNKREANHLKYQPVDTEWEVFLKKPDHNFTKGHSFPESNRDEDDCSMRSCRDCHETENTHEFLPYAQYHMRKIACETCHVPRKNYWAYKQLDMTVQYKSVTKVRGLVPGADYHDLNAEVIGFRPAYVPRLCKDGLPMITPQNLITSLYWFDTKKQRPAFKRQIMFAFMEYDDLFRLHFKPETVEIFDTDGDGELSPDELRLDTEKKYRWARKQIRAAGVADPELRLEILPFTTAHNVVGKKQALRECTECHAPDSRLLTPVEVFDYLPVNADIEVSPVVRTPPVGNTYLIKNKKIYYTSGGFLNRFYIIGAHHRPWVEIPGWLAVIGAFSGVVLHGSFRIVMSALRRKRSVRDDEKNKEDEKEADDAS